MRESQTELTEMTGKKPSGRSTSEHTAENGYCLLCPLERTEEEFKGKRGKKKTKEGYEGGKILFQKKKIFEFSDWEVVPAKT